MRCSSSNNNQFIEKYCAYEMTTEEYNNIITLAEKQQGNIYDADSLWSIYDQVNDTLRKTIPDSVNFEIFLHTLDSTHFSVSVITQKNEGYVKALSCKFMTAKFQGKIPEKRILLMYSYSNLDGSGETPLEIALKNK